MEDINDLNPYLTFVNVVRGSILITTQKPKDFLAMKDVDIVLVKPFGRDDAAAILFKVIQAEPADEKEREMARELSDAVDGLPLAIATMRGYIDQSGDNLGVFIWRLKTSSNAWTDGAVTPDNQYEIYLDTVFNIAFTTPPYKARIMTGILAFLNPDHIPVEI